MGKKGDSSSKSGLYMQDRLLVIPKPDIILTVPVRKGKGVEGHQEVKTRRELGIIGRDTEHCPQ